MNTGNNDFERKVKKKKMNMERKEMALGRTDVYAVYYREARTLVYNTNFSGDFQKIILKNEKIS